MDRAVYAYATGGAELGSIICGYLLNRAPSIVVALGVYSDAYVGGDCDTGGCVVN